jgi:hypothetical protein
MVGRRRRAVVHIGTHKTGSTSFQAWADQHRDEMAVRADTHVYQGRFAAWSHYELAILCLRPDRNMPMRCRTPDWCLDAWQQDVRNHIREQVHGTQSTLLCSAEELSYLRHSDEVERLRDLLAPREVSVIAVLRQPADFLRSYADGIARNGFLPSKYDDSFAYVELDSWLIRYHDLIESYSQVLGTEKVHVLAYEQCLQRDGSIIPEILRASGFDPATLPSSNGMWKNKSARGHTRIFRANHVVRALGRALLSRTRRPSGMPIGRRRT